MKETGIGLLIGVVIGLYGGLGGFGVILGFVIGAVVGISKYVSRQREFERRRIKEEQEILAKREKLKSDPALQAQLQSQNEFIAKRLEAQAKSLTRQAEELRNVRVG